jgi:hypothetical protein
MPLIKIHDHTFGSSIWVTKLLSLSAKRLARSGSKMPLERSNALSGINARRRGRKGQEEEEARKRGLY